MLPPAAGGREGRERGRVRERVLRICVEREAKGERGERERVCASSLGKVLRKRGNEVRRVSA